ncbi:MAG: FkbM family methyltransferase [Hyphomicrobium sp.]
MRPQRMDAKELAFVRQIMAQPGATFVDVGGNAGLYSLAAALSAGPGARILMIEPDPTLIARLDFNLETARAAHRIRDDVTVERYELAVGDHEGEAFISTTGDEGGRSIVGDANGGARTVQLATLCSVVERARLDHIDLMKIDVEGYEDRVLPPFLATADSHLWPHRIIIEHLQRDRWKPDCIADAEQRGYRQTAATRNNTILQRDAYL